MKKSILGLALALAFAGSHALAATCVTPDARPTVVIGATDTGIANVDADGAGPGNCTLNDLLKAGLPNTDWGSHKAFVTNATGIINGVPAGVLSDADKASLIAAAQASTVGNVLRVKVISFNDFHGTFNSQGAFFGVNPSGGAAAMAGVIRDLKAQNPNNAVVSAGDLTGASPLASALFHDEGTVELMNAIGLDFNAVGNHEFDYGKAELLRKQSGGCAADPNLGTSASRTCRGGDVGSPYTPTPFSGAKYKYLAANVVDTATGRTLFPAYKVKSFHGIPVAFIGMTLKDTPTIVTPSGVAGLQFNDEADTVNALIPQLRNQGIHSVVLMIHQGGFTTGGLNDCAGLTDAIGPILDRLSPEVDLIVSGHTHWGYNCIHADAQVPAGRRLTQAAKYTQVVTNTDLDIDTTTRDVIGTNSTNIIVNPKTVTPDANVAAIVAGYSALAKPVGNVVVGYITGDITKAFNAAGESQAGDIVGDAFLQATSAAPNNAVIGFTNAGGLRGTDPVFAYLASAPNNGGVGDGLVSYSEAFTFMPFGNSLVVMDITGAQLKQALEQQFPVATFLANKTPNPSCPWNVQTTRRVMQPSASLTYSWSVSRPECDRVDSATLKVNGVLVDANATYRVRVNSFLATGGDNFTAFNAGTNRHGDMQDIDAQIAWWQSNTSAAHPYTPAPLTRITTY